MAAAAAFSSRTRGGPGTLAFHVKNMHATVLTQMGLDPNRLSYFYGGLDQKLVGVEGAEPIKGIV